MRGRKAYPFQVMQATNDKNRLTKSALAGREKGQPNIKSSKLWCPQHMCDDAKKEWRRIVELYKELQDPIINDLDLASLEIYCESLVTYRRAMAKVRETAEVYASKPDANRPKKNPWLSVANDAAVLVKKYGEVLLLDPVSRARVGMAKAKEQPDNPMAEFLKKRAGASGSQ